MSDPSIIHGAEVFEPATMSYTVVVDGQGISASPEDFRDILDDYLVGNINALSVTRPDRLRLEVVSSGDNVTLTCWGWYVRYVGHQAVTAGTHRPTAHDIIRDFVSGKDDWKKAVMWEDLPGPGAPYLDENDNVVVPVFGSKPEIIAPATRRSKLNKVLQLELPIVGFGLLILWGTVDLFRDWLADDPFFERGGALTAVVLVPIAFLIVYGFHRLNWRCPFCRKPLGWEFGRNCPCSAWPKKESQHDPD
jgi:hypothetical protein